jgi:RNA polymerase sigma-70 factor (ECF subfamily)
MTDDLDAGVLDRFAHGDQGAFEQLFRHFQRDAYRWAFRIVRNPAGAEDVVVEAFWRAYRAHARFDPGRSFGAWMRRIVTRAAIDELKRSPAPMALPAEAGSAPAGGGDLRETMALAFARLPVTLRVVATLALIEERPYAEIAEALDLPVGTIKSRVFRATRALRAELARLGTK